MEGTKLEEWRNKKFTVVDSSEKDTTTKSKCQSFLREDKKKKGHHKRRKLRGRQPKTQSFETDKENVTQLFNNLVFWSE
jgi:hypothetical protein